MEGLRNCRINILMTRRLSLRGTSYRHSTGNLSLKHTDQYLDHTRMKLQRRIRLAVDTNLTF